MEGMAILIGNDPNGSDIVPMLEREGLKVEITRSPEHAIERLQELVDQRPGFSPESIVPLGPTEGYGSEVYSAESWGGRQVEGGGSPGTGGLDRRLAAVQERARALEQEEQRIINDALQHAGGNKTAAARLLGISRYALQRRLRRFAKPQGQQGPTGTPDPSGMPSPS